MVMLLFFLILSSLSAQEFYISDGLGLKGQPAESPADSLWVLSETDDSEGSVRILYKEQEEYKRWENKTFLKDGNYLTREMYFYRDSLRTETIHNHKDLIMEEVLYDSEGSFLTRKIYSYDRTGRLSRVEKQDEQGLPQAGHSVLYRQNGSLRSIQSDNDDRIEWRSSDFSRHYLDTLYLKEESVSSIYQYKDDQIFKRSISSDGQNIQDTFYYYNTLGHLEKEEIFNYPEDTRTQLFYNPDGQLLIKNRYRSENLEYSEVFTYDSGLLIRKQQRSSNIRLIWMYEYKGDEDPYLTRQYRNGVLTKETEIMEDGTWERLFRNNTVILERLKPDEES